MDVTGVLRFQARDGNVFDKSNDTVVVTRALLTTAAAEIERLHADLRIAGDKFAEVCDENERLRTQLMRAYQFVSPLSDPMPITNREMADEIMRCLEQTRG